MNGAFGVDFGVNVPGESGIAATGTTIATAYQLTKKVTVFGSVVAGGMAILPSSYASGAHLVVKNRGANTLMISPGSDQIESYGTGVAVGVAPGGDAEFVSFDPPAGRPPKTWWL